MDASRRRRVDVLHAGTELHDAVAVIERTADLDQPARCLQRAAQRAFPQGPVRDLLSGTWLGHPLHPMLTDLPIGFWTSAWVLDLLGPRRHATRPGSSWASAS